MKKLKILTLICIFAMNLNATLADNSNVPWASLPANKTCVAYKTSKGMFLFATVDVIGVSCTIEMEIDQKNLIIKIPVTSFDSDSSKRDEVVAEILGGKNLSPLVFETSLSALTSEEFKKSLSGVLKIKGTPNSIKLKKEFSSDNSLRLVLDTTFKALNVKVSSVVGGLIASPNEELSIFVSIPEKEIISLKNKLRKK